MKRDTQDIWASLLRKRSVQTRSVPFDRVCWASVGRVSVRENAKEEARKFVNVFLNHLDSLIPNDPSLRWTVVRSSPSSAFASPSPPRWPVAYSHWILDVQLWSRAPSPSTIATPTAPPPPPDNNYMSLSIITMSLPRLYIDYSVSL